MAVPTEYLLFLEQTIARFL